MVINQTKLKVRNIPKSWTTKPFKEISSMHGRIGWQGLKQTEFTSNDDDPFLITGMNFKEGKIRWDEVYHISYKRYEMAKEIQLKKNDVLMTKDGTIGKLLYVDNIPYPGLASLNSHLLVFRPILNSYVPKFLYYQLSSQNFTKHIEENKSGSTFYGISQEAVGKYDVILPPIIEQRSIAKVLSDVDDFIFDLDQLIAKKRAIKQGAMQQLLTGNAKLLGFKQDWEKVELGEIAKFQKGRRLSKDDIDQDGSDPCIHYGELFTKYPEEIVNIISRTNVCNDMVRSQVNDVLMPTSDVTPNGLAVASCIKRADVILGGDILIIRAPEDEIIGTFLSYVIRMSKVQVMQLVTGTTVFHIYKSDMKNFRFTMPGIDEQNAIISILRDIDKEIIELVIRKDKIRSIKKGLMQELLTGKTRLI